jgi:hypothetical protein
MRNAPNFEKSSKSIKPNNFDRMQTLVLDIENTIVSKVEIQNMYELNELRKTKDYFKNYIEVDVISQ